MSAYAYVRTYTVVLVLVLVLVLFFFLLSVFLSVTVVGTGRCMYLGSLGTSGARCSVMRRFRTENGLLDWAVGRTSREILCLGFGTGPGD